MVQAHKLYRETDTKVDGKDFYNGYVKSEVLPRPKMSVDKQILQKLSA